MRARELVIIEPINILFKRQEKCKKAQRGTLARPICVTIITIIILFTLFIIILFIIHFIIFIITLFSALFIIISGGKLGKGTKSTLALSICVKQCI